VTHAAKSFETKMVASVNTVEKVMSVILKYVDKDNINNMILELEEIPGNKSFLDTIQRLRQQLKTDSKEPNTS
jgi:hypothetical protein